MMQLMSLYFCQVCLLTIFSASIVGKIRDFPEFVLVVKSFSGLKRKTAVFSAILVLILEIVIVSFAVSGSLTLNYALFLANILLVIFIFGIIYAVINKSDTSCGCFGDTRSKVSYADAFRNILLIVLFSYGIYLDQKVNFIFDVSLFILIVPISIACSILIMRFSNILTYARRLFSYNLEVSR